MSSPSKFRGGDSAPASKVLDRHPLVEEYDSAGTDEGVRIVTLVAGWAFEDAAQRLEDDPHSIMALHSKGCSTVKDALERIRTARPCRCGRCMSKDPNLPPIEPSLPA